MTTVRRPGRNAAVRPSRAVSEPKRRVSSRTATSSPAEASTGAEARALGGPDGRPRSHAAPLRLPAARCAPGRRSRRRRSSSSGTRSQPPRPTTTASGPAPFDDSSLTLPSRIETTRSAIAVEAGSWLTTIAEALRLAHELPQELGHVRGGAGVQLAGRLVGQQQAGTGARARRRARRAAARRRTALPGRASRRSSSPTRSSSSSARRPRSSAGTPARPSVAATSSARRQLARERAPVVLVGVAGRRRAVAAELPCGEAAEVVAGNVHRAGRGALEAGEHAEQRRLARAARPEHDADLAVGDVEGEALQRGHAAVAAREDAEDVAQLDELASHRLSRERPARGEHDEPAGDRDVQRARRSRRRAGRATASEAARARVRARSPRRRRSTSAASAAPARRRRPARTRPRRAPAAARRGAAATAPHPRPPGRGTRRARRAGRPARRASGPSPRGRARRAPRRAASAASRARAGRASRPPRARGGTPSRARRNGDCASAPATSAAEASSGTSTQTSLTRAAPGRAAWSAVTSVPTSPTAASPRAPGNRGTTPATRTASSCPRPAAAAGRRRRPRRPSLGVTITGGCSPSVGWRGRIREARCGLSTRRSRPHLSPLPRTAAPPAPTHCASGRPRRDDAERAGRCPRRRPAPAAGSQARGRCRSAGRPVRRAAPALRAAARAGRVSPSRIDRASPFRVRMLASRRTRAAGRAHREARADRKADRPLQRVRPDRGSLCRSVVRARAGAGARRRPARGASRR